MDKKIDKYRYIWNQIFKEIYAKTDKAQSSEICIKIFPQNDFYKYFFSNWS